MITLMFDNRCSNKVSANPNDAAMSCDAPFRKYNAIPSRIPGRLQFPKSLFQATVGVQPIIRRNASDRFNGNVGELVHVAAIGGMCSSHPHPRLYHSPSGWILKIMDLLTTQPAFDAMWQLAICAATLHLVVMKMPQQADSALTVIPSIALALPTFLLFLYWRGVSLAEGLCLFSLFNVIFVSLCNPPADRVLVGGYFANHLQCIFPTSWDSWFVLVYGNGFNISVKYIYTARLFQYQWSPKTAETARRIW